jgi:DNA-binding transcriptional MerR regulator
MVGLENGPVHQVEPRFSLADLVESSGLPERTVRNFITEGLVPPALGRGRSRYYTTDHLQRLELVARLRAERLSFDEIRDRLSAPDTTATPEGETWQRLTLHPDLELLVRDDASESVQALARELALQARQWFGEE